MTIATGPAPLPGVRLMVGTPMYDGRCHSGYLYGMCELTAQCNKAGVPLQVCFPCGDALVMTARNTIADRFLRSDATHLLMIDSDIGFSASDAFALLALQVGMANTHDVVTAPYPVKRLDWASIDRAAREGLASPDVWRLEHFATDIALKPIAGGRFDPSQPVEVGEAGTGFMAIRRATLERFRTAYPNRRYAAAPSDLREGSGSEIAQFFDTAVEGGPDTLDEDLRRFLGDRPDADRAGIEAFLASREVLPGAYVSEDHRFCRLVRAAGMHIWSCPWINLTHTGSHTYRTRVADLARVRGALA